LLYGLNGKKAARAVLNARLQAASNQKPEAAELTLQEFVAGYWRPYLDRKQVKPSTKAGYESVLKIHIVPTLGEMRLVDLAPLHIEDLLHAKAKDGLGPKTVRNVLVLLQGILALAVDNDLIERSPVRNRHKPVVLRQEKPVWTSEQVRTILENAPAEYRAFFTAAALTGARLGELLALQWRHVDFEGRTLRIEQSLWHGQLVTTKTVASVRTIPFGDALAQTLEEHLRTSRHIGPTDATSSRRHAERCALLDSRPFRHLAPGPVFGLPYLPAFSRQFHQCANWQYQARSKNAWALEYEHHRRHLHAYVDGLRSRSSKRD
jgi:integrase